MSTFRKDRVRPAIDGESLQKLPTAPRRYDKGTKKLWRVVCNDLKQRGRLYLATVHLIEKYCDSQQIYSEATTAIFEEDQFVDTVTVQDGQTERKNPIHGVRSKALEEILKLEKVLGFSPYSRDRITVSEPEEEDDPFS